MAQPTLLQQNTAVTAAAGPASITPTFGGASTAGNFLVLVVCVTGTTPTITTPGGWTSIRNNVTNSIAIGVFILPNNAGGITAVAVTLGGTAGGAAASLFEFTGFPAVSINSLEISGIATNAGSVNPKAVVSGNISTPQLNELIFAVVAFAAANVNATANSFDLANSIGTGVSTSGAPNAQLACFWGTTLFAVVSQVNLTLNASVAWQAEVLRFSTQGQAITYNSVGGNPGTVWPQYNQGMIGG